MRENNLDEAQALLKQYRMFSKALNFVDNEKDKSDICSEMDKLELQILDLTNISYEKELKKIQEEKTSFLKEERLKLQRLVDIISSRVDYVNLVLKRHKLFTGNLLTAYTIVDEDKLLEYKNNIRIIDKYRENLRNKADLISDIKTLDTKIGSAKDRIDGNKKNNAELEEEMISLIRKALIDFKCDDLLERKREINLAYEELGYSLSMAKENVRVAKLGNSSDIIMECDNMLSSITLEYERYKEKKYILELMDIYDQPVSEYSDLIKKREKIKDILKNISNSELYKEINDDLEKQFNIIKLEQQDVDTYNSLCEEKDRKTNLIEKIDEENSSEEFRSFLDEFLRNEKKYREELYLEQQKKEYAERQRKMLRDKEIQEERNRRQKLIEEERNKDIEKRTRELLKEKQKVNADSQIKKSEVPTTRVERNSNINTDEVIGSRYFSNKDKNNVDDIPVIKNDKLTSRVVDNNAFFDDNELKEINDLNNENNGSNGNWF